MKKLLLSAIALVMTIAASAATVVESSVFNGKLGITLDPTEKIDMEDATDASITVNKMSDGTYTFTLNQFSFAGMLIGDATASGLEATEQDGAIVLTATDKEAPVTNGDLSEAIGGKVVMSLTATIKDGLMTADISKIVVELMGTPMEVAARFETTPRTNRYDFVDKNGNVVPSGSTITFSDYEDDGFGSIQVSTGLTVKKNIADDDDNYGVSTTFSITKLDNGTIQCCFPANCSPKSDLGTATTRGATFESGASLATEWFPTGYGEAEVRIGLNVTKKTTMGVMTSYDTIDKTEGECTYIIARFVYTDPTGINETIADRNASVVAVYAADGKRIAAPQKGLNIVRMSNGKTVKVVK